MNYLLKQIAEICNDSPDARLAGRLADFQHRLDEFDEGMGQILRLTHELQRVLDGEPHRHVAGTLADLHIDTCAKCGFDIRNEIHRHEDQDEGQDQVQKPGSV